MRKFHTTAALLLALSTLSAFGQSEPIAVAVHPKNTATNITMSRLREIFQCERTSWPRGERIALFSRVANTPEHNVMLKMIYQLNEGEYKQYWVMKQLRGETSCKSTELPSRGMTMEALKIYSGAVALIRLSEVTADMKVLTVDGKRPESSDYPLR